MKEERVEAEEEGKESPTKRTWRERRGWEREVKWREGEEERERLREEERDPKESLVALGSRRNWLVKKVSSPGIGRVVVAVVVVSKRSKRRVKIAADPPLMRRCIMR
ncbi:hypothetical protein DY000_02025773 [Brassica cretica]|uniref:Uncharacterized protein n=1 Tax=Brassica cretica TaxID=69181 RepID=A0ABQ7EF91_BRACR|nr:hypothetical protein DY000_02025773 [Brassica cretica]